MNPNFLDRLLEPWPGQEEHGPELPQEESLLDADHPGSGVLIARRSISFTR